MTVAGVVEAYTAKAAEYTDLFGSIDAVAAIDREQVLRWAAGVHGRIIDVGCGPGQWTSFLGGHGLDIEGIDPAAVFVEEAQRRHPNVAFRVGRAQALDVEPASVGGVLAWFSLIHIDPTELSVAVNEFARCLRNGGGLAIGFFEGPELEPFDHAVAPAYFWPTDLLSDQVEQAGFTVTETHARTDPGVRRQGLLLAQQRK